MTQPKDPADKGLDSFTSHRSGYGNDALDALRERQIRDGGTMEAGEGAKLHARIDALEAEIAAMAPVIAAMTPIAANTPERLATGTGPNRRRLTRDEAERGALPAPFTDAEWAAMHAGSQA